MRNLCQIASTLYRDRHFLVYYSLISCISIKSSGSYNSYNGNCMYISVRYIHVPLSTYIYLQLSLNNRIICVQYVFSLLGNIEEKSKVTISLEC